MLVFSCSNDQKQPEPAEPEVRIPTAEEIKPTPKAGSEKAVELTSFMNNAKTDLTGYAMESEDFPIVIEELLTVLKQRSSEFNITFKKDTNKFTLKIEHKADPAMFEYLSISEEITDTETISTKELKIGENVYKIVGTKKFGSTDEPSQKFYLNGTEITTNTGKVSDQFDEMMPVVVMKILELGNKGPITLLGGKLKINLNINIEEQTFRGKIIFSKLAIGKNTYSAVGEINVMGGQILLKASGNTSGDIGDHTVALVLNMNLNGVMSAFKFYIDDYNMSGMFIPETDPPTTT